MTSGRVLHRLFPIILSMVLLLTLIPFGPLPKVMADGITLLNGLGSYTDPSNPKNVSTASILVSGYANGDPRNATVAVYQQGTSNGGTIPITPQVSGNTFTFNSVPLYSGLNKIHVASGVSYTDVYVYYTGNPSISNLQIFDASTGNYIPFKPYDTNSASRFDNVTTSQSTGLRLQGDVNNTTSVEINGTSALYSPPSPRFIFNGGMNNMVKGDFKLRFTGKNASGSSYVLAPPTAIAVENGEPTLLEAQLGGTPLDQLSTTFTPVGGNNLTGTFYVTKRNSVNTKFSSVKVSILNESGLAVINPEIDVNVAGLPVTSTSAGYVTYNFSASIPSIAGLDASKVYTVKVTPYDGSRAYVSQNYPVKPGTSGAASISNVTVASSGKTLVDNASLSIDDSLKVKTDPNTTSVTIKFSANGATQTVTNYTTNSDGTRTFIIDLNSTALAGGKQDVSFLPNGSTDNQLVIKGVNILLVPTVQVLGLSDGQVINDLKDPAQFPNGGLTVKYLNLPGTANRTNTKMKLNGINIGTDSADGLYRSGALTDDKFYLKLGSGSHSSGPAIHEGPNTLSIEITNGSETSSVVIGFSYLPNNTPGVASFLPLNAMTTTNAAASAFTADPKQKGVYYTKENVVRLQWKLADTKGKMIILKKNNVEILRLQKSGSGWVKVGSTSSWYTPSNAADQETVYSTPTYSSGDDAFIAGHKGTAGKGDMSLLYKDDQENTLWSETTTYTLDVYTNFQGTDPVAPASSSTITIVRQQSLYELIGDAKKIADQNWVTNGNFFPFDAYLESAEQVTVNKLPAVKVINESAPDSIKPNGRDRYRVKVPLKKGTNTLKVEITRGGKKVNDTITVFYADTPIPGAAYRETLGKKSKFAIFNGKLQLSFPKNTLLTTSVDRNSFNLLLNEQPMLFGMANPSNGFVSQSDSDNTGWRRVLSGNLTAPVGYQIIGDLFWVDAGRLQDDNTSSGGLTPLAPGMEITNTNSSARPITKNLIPTQRGTVTLKYDDQIRNVYADRLTVMYNDGVSDRGWVNIGAKVDDKKKIAEAPFDKFGYYAVMRQATSYKDISEHDWAKDELILLSSRGWMKPNGDSINNFGVYKPATRGEMATILVKVFNIPINADGDPTFQDILPSSPATATYDYEHIETAARVGIVSGTGVGIFDPEGSLTREQAAIMIARAANYKLNDKTKAKQTLDKAFLDSSQINTYAYPAIEAVYKAKIINGVPVINPTNPKAKAKYNFQPKTTLTRDQLAAVVYSLLKNQKIIK